MFRNKYFEAMSVYVKSNLPPPFLNKRIIPNTKQCCNAQQCFVYVNMSNLTPSFFKRRIIPKQINDCSLSVKQCKDKVIANVNCARVCWPMLACSENCASLCWPMLMCCFFEFTMRNVDLIASDSKVRILYVDIGQRQNPRQSAGLVIAEH